VQLPAAPDYSNPQTWLAFPAGESKLFDIFYLYPTFYQGAPGALMDVNNTRLKPFITVNALKNTAIFSGNGNIFAPLYRQASFATIGLSEGEKQAVLKYSIDDVCAAFDYFLKHFSTNNRPFVLAGHSQGSRLLRELMKLKFKDPQINRRLIAAYLIGAEVTKEDIQTHPWLKPASNAHESGVIITYNCQAAGIQNSPIYERGNAICTNPLNWSKEPAPKNLHLGAVFFDKTGALAREIPAFTSAYIEEATGALITPDVDAATYSTPHFPKGILHIHDYEFFFRNLQQNFQTRLQKHLGL